jgi:hypothetical protein
MPPGLDLLDDNLPRFGPSARRGSSGDTLATLCYPGVVQDTSAEAAQIQAAVHRKMGGVRKFLMACKMSDSVRAIARDGIRDRHPEFDEIAVRDELIWELYGIRRGG